MYRHILMLGLYIYFQVFHRAEQPCIPNLNGRINVSRSPADLGPYEIHGPGPDRGPGIPHGTSRDLWDRCYANGGQPVLPSLGEGNN